MPKRTHRNPDHVQRHNQASPNNEAIANQLEGRLCCKNFGCVATPGDSLVK